MRTTLTLVASLVVSGCFPGEQSIDGFTEQEYAIIEQMGPIPEVPSSPSNKYADDPAAATFGQKLFFEKGYAGPLVLPGTGLGNVGDVGRVSCESCHDAKKYFTDTRSRPSATSVAIGWQGRNSPSMVNVAFYTWGGWGGKNDSIWSHAATCEVPVNFAGNRLQFAHLMYRKYRADYDAVFLPLDPALDPTHPEAARFPEVGKPKAMNMPDGAWELMAPEDREHVNLILANTGKALEAYFRKLVSRNAPIDQYIAGDRDALTPAQKRGLALFIGKAACVDCHSGPTFTDQQFHNTGVPQRGADFAALVDAGRFQDTTFALNNPFGVAGKYSDDPAWGAEKLATIEPGDHLKGMFRTKSLRHIDKTAPYMHNGSLETLEEVVRFYNQGGGHDAFEGVKSAAMRRLELTGEEQADLVAFLTSLTGENVPVELQQDTTMP